MAAYVELPRPLSEEEHGRLARHLALARELGAELITTSDDDVVRGLLRVAREQNVTQLVVGKPVGWRGLDLLRGGSLLNRLIRESGQLMCMPFAPRAKGFPGLPDWRASGGRPTGARNALGRRCGGGGDWF